MVNTSFASLASGVYSNVYAGKGELMANVVISGRVDERIRHKAEIMAKAAGLSLGAFVSGCVIDMVESGQIPRSSQEIEDDRIIRMKLAHQNLKEISKAFATNTPLDSMSHDELMEEAYGDRA